MIDLNRIEEYRENNRIEAKKALGGLPHSIWETYSAFANTLGGVILLGVEEYRDHSLHVINLPDPEGMVREFWQRVNDQNQASANILSRESVQVEVVEGKRIIVITVPRASRLDRPVYIGTNPMTGTYRRNGEGDYRCSVEDVQSMFRDADVRTLDMRVLEDMDLDVLSQETILRYRTRLCTARPGHIWSSLEDPEFLYRLGAAGKGIDGVLHPTGAGLLMFGWEYEILREFPNYFLDYREQMGRGEELTDRLTSASGEWSGNLFDFYLEVYERIVQEIHLPSSLVGKQDTPVHRALREALANSVMNADYYGRQGLVIQKRKDLITFSNPGAFRIAIEAARSGGVADPRNAGLVKMFNLVNIGRRTGSGIPGIYAVWKEQGWAMPQIRESFQPDRITLSLAICKADQLPRAGRIRADLIPYRELLVSYLTDHISASSAELSGVLGLSIGRTRALLREMVQEGFVVPWGGGASRVYRMKA